MAPFFHLLFCIWFPRKTGNAIASNDRGQGLVLLVLGMMATSTMENAALMLELSCD
jgi:hypothetical protein